MCDCPVQFQLIWMSGLTDQLFVVLENNVVGKVTIRIVLSRS